MGSQPFGGEGLSGTGPKAGGPHYVRRLTAGAAPAGGLPAGTAIDAGALGAAIADAGRALAAGPQRRSDHGRAGARFAALDLPGPTGESNRLSFAPRGVVLCLGPGADAARAQAALAREAGNAVVVVADGATHALGAEAAAAAADACVRVLDGQVAPAALATLPGIAAVACCAERSVLAAMRTALARRSGPILPLISEHDAPERYALERHVCVDTTAAGGNASLLAEAGD